MDNAAQERARGQHNSGTINQRPIRQFYPGDTLIGHFQINNFTFDHCQIVLGHRRSQHLALVNCAVCLCARALHGGAFAAVQQAELDAGLVGNFAHHAVHRINFAYQVPLAQSANGRITGHHANAGQRHRDKRCIRAHPRSRVGGLCTRMATTDHQNVKMFHVKHSCHLPKQKLEKISSSRFSTSMRPTRNSRLRIATRSSSAAKS